MFGSVKAGQTFDNTGSSATVLFVIHLIVVQMTTRLTNGELALALDKFKDGETVDINLLIMGYLKLVF